MKSRKIRLSLQGMVVALWLAADQPAFAQFVSSSGDATSDGVEGGNGDAKASSTELDLRLTLSSFAYAETGRDGPPLFEGGQELQTASPARRLFGDLRLDLGAKHVGGSKLELKFDGRLRETNRGDVQSGFRGGEEWDLRDAYVRYGSNASGFTLGRQWISAADSNKVDGLSYRHQGKGAWSLVLFGGLYPTRGSRSLTQDYPRGTLLIDEDGNTMNVGRRIVPAIVGVGTSYAKPMVHGEVGTGAIVPFRRDGAAESRERPQVFVHSNGYWSTSSRTMLYHYATADLTSPYGAGLRNLSASVRTQATEHLMLRTSVHHQSTDLLRQSVINQLEEPDTATMGLVQNSLTLSRVASQSVRAAASVDAGKRRFQFTLGAGARQRPEVELVLADGTAFVFPTSRRSEMSLQVLDRHSLLGLRLAGQFTLIQGLGKKDLATSKGGVASLEASREFMQGKTMMTVDVAAQSLEDSSRRGSCDPTDPLTCYGQSQVRAAQAGLQLSVQAAKSWLFLIDGHWGIEKIETQDAQEQPLKLPSVQSLTAFARVRYRFR